MEADFRMRNGSAVSPGPGRDQGYDSRLKNYKPELSVSFPVELAPGESLVSTISNETLPVRVIYESLMWGKEKQANSALKAAAILTVLAGPPPEDAFRPAYAGGAKKTIYRAGDLRWDILPSLAVPAGADVDWDRWARYLERPWLDHVATWLSQYLGPTDNQPNYGREISRIGSIAGLMLMLDVPREKKEKLMVGFVQLGIDLNGLAEAGRQWSADGGHWNGRKWPILFAGLMLGDDSFGRQAGKTIFSEDQQTYYGKGWQGALALYQIVNHTGPKSPHEEKPPSAWDADNKRAESYRIVVSGGLPGTALAAQLMGAKSLWNHDAFFDYYDRWMSAEDPYASGRGNIPRPKQEGKSLDPFVDAMWAAYRTKVPKQAGGRDNLKWVRSSVNDAAFVPNPIPR